MSRAEQLVLILIPLAYLAGSIPFGLLIGLARGIDPRKAGSGNIGATNLGRLLGGRYFALVFTLDLLKGLLPMLAAAWLLYDQSKSPAVYLLWLIVGLAAIFGHMFSIFLSFKGGKGVSTSLGVVLGLYPFYTLPGLIAAAIFVLLFLATRYVSVGSIVAAVSFPLLYLLLGWLLNWPDSRARLPLLIFAIFMAAMILYKHRGNLARLRAGTEHRFVRKPAQQGG